MNTNQLFTFDLPDLIRKLKRNDGWDRGELTAMVLLKEPDKQIVLTALHPGTEIRSFQSSDYITLHIIEGTLKFLSSKKSEILGKDQLLTLQDKTRYKLISCEETVFLMTIVSQALNNSRTV
jgi:hypothetical protein